MHTDHQDTHNRVAGRVPSSPITTLVALGLLLGGAVETARAACCRSDNHPGRCMGRPKAFGPVGVGLGSLHGFAVQGCFDGTGVDRKAVDNIGVGVTFVCHPPLTPEEREELRELAREFEKVTPGRKSADWYRRRGRWQALERKCKQFRTRPYEVRVHAVDGMRPYRVDSFELTLEVKDERCAHPGRGNHDGHHGDQPCDEPRILKITHEDDALRLPHPWEVKMRPIRLRAVLMDYRCRPGEVREPEGMVEVEFVHHQIRTNAFGTMQVREKEDRSVIALASYMGRCSWRPAWYAYLKKGRERDGVWHEDPDHPGRDHGDKDHEEEKGKDKGKDNEKGNNGVGNGVDPQPPGDPKPNDGAGTGPGNPGNKSGGKSSDTSGSRNKKDDSASKPGGNPTKGNNGVGNGQDPQPPGDPKVNDGSGTGPGNPGASTQGKGSAGGGTRKASTPGGTSSGSSNRSPTSAPPAGASTSSSRAQPAKPTTSKPATPVRRSRVQRRVRVRFLR